MIFEDVGEMTEARTQWRPYAPNPRLGWWSQVVSLLRAYGGTDVEEGHYALTDADYALAYADARNRSWLRLGGRMLNLVCGVVSAPPKGYVDDGSPDVTNLTSRPFAEAALELADPSDVQTYEIAREESRTIGLFDSKEPNEVRASTELRRMIVVSRGQTALRKRRLIIEYRLGGCIVTDRYYVSQPGPLLAAGVTGLVCRELDEFSEAVRPHWDLQITLKFSVAVDGDLGHVLGKIIESRLTDEVELQNLFLQWDGKRAQYNRV